jgi:hypothetical protein
LNVPIPEAVQAGIGYRTVRDFRGIVVPPFEEHVARAEIGYTLAEWYDMHYFERAFEVACYRLRVAVKNHQEAAQLRAAKAKGRGRHR